MNQLNRKPFTPLVRAAEWRVSNFSAQELATTAWAFASAGAAQPRLFDAIAIETLERLEELSPIEVSMLAWACARLGD